MKKYSLVFILIFFGFGAVFAQTREVVWQGYRMKSESADFRGDKNIFDIVFINALRDQDRNNGYLSIFPGYDPETPASPDYFYDIVGAIEQYRGNIYAVSTELRRNKIKISTFFKRADIGETSLHTIIQQHAKDIYAYFEYFVRIEKEESLQRLLADFDREYMQKISSMNIEEYNQAFQRLSIIESKFGKPDEINKRREGIEYSAIAIPLFRAEENIARTFDERVSDDASDSFCETAEIFALQVRQVIGQSKDSRFLARLEKVESKIDEYRNKLQFAVYTGGLGLFIDKPLLMMLDGPDIDFQELCPGILGLTLRYTTPIVLPMLWYFQFSYTGINGGMKKIPVVYLTETAIHSFSLSTGQHLQFYINRRIAPYGYFGIGYTHLIEYASDGKDSVFLGYPGMIADVGLGTRLHLSSKFALEAKAQWNFMLYQSMMMAVNFSLGGSYLFHGKEYLTRR